MSVYDVEQKPNYIYKGKTYPLFVDRFLNPKYLEILIQEFSTSELIGKINGTVYINFHINRNGEFDGRITKLSAPPAYFEVIKIKLLDILKNSVIYTSAIHKGKVIEWSNSILLPIKFVD